MAIDVMVRRHEMPASLKGRVRFKPCEKCGALRWRYTGSTVAEDVHEFTCDECKRTHILAMPKQAPLPYGVKDPERYRAERSPPPPKRKIIFPC